VIARSWAVIPLLLLSCVASAEGPGFSTDSMPDDELRAYRKERVAELRKRAAAVNPQETDDGTIYSGIFFCTVYYTPKESGFTAERGFDATPTTAPGLKGRTYPRDFLAAVKKEGYGRLVTPVDGLDYLRWAGDGAYAYAKVPLGRRGEVLEPRRSCAISGQNNFLRQHDTIRIKAEGVNTEFGSDDWFICDTGGGVHPLQIDLYWGEDEPRGAVGRARARPAGTAFEYAFEVEVTVEPRKAKTSTEH
jgi:hypothetical protein